MTQQAKYFADEAKFHDNAAERWKWGSFMFSGVVVLYAVSTLFFPQFDWLTADTTAEAIQLTVSKILIFGVLASILLLSVRNFSAHKHNSIVNKHRQNALMTYTTLADAGSSVEARDAILQHAAAAIYAPNDTGYLKNEERGYGQSLPLNISPRVLGQSSSESP